MNVKNGRKSHFALCIAQFLLDIILITFLRLGNFNGFEVNIYMVFRSLTIAINCFSMAFDLVNIAFNGFSMIFEVAAYHQFQ